MASLWSPFTALDKRLSHASMSDCMVAGISGWCGMSCPVLCAGKCDDDEMNAAKKEEATDD